MIRTIKCPACQKFVEPLAFQLWPGSSVDICPLCRVGVGNLTDDMEVKSIDAPPRDKMMRRAKKTKAVNED